MSPTVRSDTGIAKHRIYLERSARRRTRSGGPRPARTGAERRHRTFEPWQGSKKKRYRFGIVLFQARDGDRTRDPLLGKEVLHR